MWHWTWPQKPESCNWGSPHLSNQVSTEISQSGQHTPTLTRRHTHSHKTFKSLICDCQFVNVRGEEAVVESVRGWRCCTCFSCFITGACSAASIYKSNHLKLVSLQTTSPITPLGNTISTSNVSYLSSTETLRALVKPPSNKAPFMSCNKWLYCQLIKSFTKAL